ncbi:hypothetical protein [Endozoicomonas ascidiicola]|uniref:hypothetical protein n=1 Tax=Endozoicomonas ascidiicola TaxID=1698521 RepID=UPI00082EDF28|nr:hypothetical protein [Endozoicomonas ascidiicola]
MDHITGAVAQNGQFNSADSARKNPLPIEATSKPDSSKPKAGLFTVGAVENIAIPSIISVGACKLLDITSLKGRGVTTFLIFTTYLSFQLFRAVRSIDHSVKQSEADNKNWRNSLSDPLPNILVTAGRSVSPNMTFSPSNESVSSYKTLIDDPTKERALTITSPFSTSDELKKSFLEGLESVIESGTLDLNREMGFIISCYSTHQNTPDFTQVLHADHNAIHLVYPEGHQSYKAETAKPENMMNFLAEVVLQHSNLCFQKAKEENKPMTYQIGFVNL